MLRSRRTGKGVRHRFVWMQQDCCGVAWSRIHLCARMQKVFRDAA
jgi:hypothetical protein